MTNHEGKFSRPAVSNPLGKCTEDIKTVVDEQTAEALTALAYANGLTRSEYVRSVLQAHVHGYGTMLRLTGGRIGPPPIAKDEPIGP